MRISSPTLIVAACGLAASLSGTACADRGEMASDRNDAAAQEGTAANRTPMTVTGCFQEASGFNNFVLTNTTGSQGSPEQRAQGYRIERGGDLEQHVGKQVRVTGWVDTDDAASMHDRTSSQTPTAGQGGQQTERMEFNDLPELHVENIERVNENCASTQGGAGR